MSKICSKFKVSVPEVANAGKDHGDAVFVCRFDDFLVANRAPRLNDGSCSCGGNLVDSVTKGEERVRGDYRALKRTLRFQAGNLDGIDATHLSGSNPNSDVFPGKHNRIGSDILCDNPGKFHGLPFG